MKNRDADAWNAVRPMHLPVAIPLVSSHKAAILLPGSAGTTVWEGKKYYSSAEHTPPVFMGHRILEEVDIFVRTKGRNDVRIT